MEAPLALDMPVDAQKKRHHVKLLVDAGHAEWRSPKQHIARITNDGYDFLNVVESGDLFDKFKKLFDGGMTYVESAHRV